MNWRDVKQMSIFQCLALPGLACVPLSAMATVGFVLRPQPAAGDANGLKPSTPPGVSAKSAKDAAAQTN
jgi:hypothetical protein